MVIVKTILITLAICFCIYIVQEIRFAMWEKRLKYKFKRMNEDLRTIKTISGRLKECSYKNNN